MHTSTIRNMARGHNQSSREKDERSGRTVCQVSLFMYGLIGQAKALGYDKRSRGKGKRSDPAV